jgi:hypothetical protein
MIPEFAKRWVDVRHWIEEKWRADPPDRYEGIWQEVCYMLASLGVDPESRRFDMIGDWSGDAVGHVTSADGSKVWHAVHGYGSCSGCDAFEAAIGPEDFWTIGLHMVQSMKEGE